MGQKRNTRLRRRVLRIFILLSCSFFIWYFILRTGNDAGSTSTPDPPTASNRLAGAYPTSSLDVEPTSAEAANLVRIVGFVVDESGSAPVPATVTVYSLSGVRTGVEMANVSTDSSGCFTIEDLVSGTKVVLAAESKDGQYRSYLTRGVYVLGPGDNEVILTALAGMTLKGVVVDALTGRAVSGAAVQCCSDAAYNYHVLSDGDGSFVFKGVFGTVDLVAEAEGYGMSVPWRLRIDPGHKEVREVQLVLRPERRLAGVVHDVLGRPIIGARLIIGFEADVKRATSDAEGKFMVRGVPAGVILSFTAAYRDEDELGRQFTPVQRRFPPKEDVSDLAVEMISVSCARGLVVDWQGTGLAHAPVTVYSRSSGRIRVEHCQRADSVGRFEISGLAPGPHLVGTLNIDSLPDQLKLRVEGVGRLVQFESEPGGVVNVGRIDGSWICVVRGQVVDVEGNGFGREEGRYVEVVARTDLEGYRPASMVSPDGTFNLDVLTDAFPCLLTARIGPDFVSEPKVLHSPPGPDAKLILKEARDRAVGTLVVRVIDSRGNPVHEFDVLIDGDVGGVSRDYGRSFSDASAGATWPNIVEGVYRLRIQVPGPSIHTHGFVRFRSREETVVVVQLPDR